MTNPNGHLAFGHLRSRVQNDLSVILPRIVVKRLGRSSQATATMLSLLAPAILAGLNIALSFPLFTGEYTQHMASIESAFISDARFILENYPHINWYPLWYLGFPFHLTYPPLVPYLTALVSAVSGVSAARSYRVLVALIYVLCPVTLYFFAQRLMRSRFWASVCALAYVFFPSSYYLCFPDAAQRLQACPSVRLVNLAFYGEGPHTLGLAITPLAALFFLEAVEKPRSRNCVLAAVSVAAVALVNLIAFFALAVILAVLLLVELSRGIPLNAVWKAFICLSLAYGLIAFTYDASFVRASVAFGEQGTSPWGWLMTLLLLTGSILVARLTAKRGMGWAVAATWVVAFGGIISLWRLFGLTVAPQPKRYIPELDMGIALLIGLAAKSLSQQGGLKRFLIAAVVIAAALSFVLSWRASWSIAEPNEDITNTVEYQVAVHLESLVSCGERIYATGSTAFWLNVFTNIPQVRGGSDQGATNPWWAHIMYQVNTGEDPDTSIQWLKALNVRYVVVDFPNASTVYNDYIYPFKFEGRLEKLFQWGGVSVYEIPTSNSAWVQLVNSEAAEHARPIWGVLDREGLADYLEMVENSTANGSIEYVVKNPDEITLSVVGGSGRESLLVKSTFDPRWRATFNGVDVPIEKIGPDFMLISPRRAGSYEIELTCTRSASEVVGLAISALSVTTMLVIQVYRHLTPRLEKEQCRWKDWSRVAQHPFQGSKEKREKLGVTI